MSSTETQAPVTAVMRRHLRIIRDSMPMGCTRAPGGWFGTAGKIGLRDAAPLTIPRLAFVDFRGRHPRLKITSAGRAEIAGKDEL